MTPEQVDKPWLGDLLAEAFGATVEHVERGGRTVHGAPPRWVGWQCVRGDEMAAQSWDPSELVRASRAVSREAPR